MITFYKHDKILQTELMILYREASHKITVGRKLRISDLITMEQKFGFLA